MAEECSSLARKRWDLLRAALLNKRTSGCSIDSTNSASVRRFSTFDLFNIQMQTKSLPQYLETGSQPVQWLSYHYTSTTPNLKDIDVNVAIISQGFTLQEIFGFNNTGNVCIWPSEEVMAFYCMENFLSFKGLSVCELGAGMTGLAGVMLAATQTPYEVVLTDGNEKSVDNLKAIIHANGFKSPSVIASNLCWDASRLESDFSCFIRRFDVLLCADCLFFTTVHKDLVVVMQQLLKPNGRVYIFAPDRSGTFEMFCEVAEEYFRVEFIDCYHELVQQRHSQYMRELQSYDPNIHYPKCVVLHLK